MTQTLQILQVVLFAIPTLTLLGIGAAILLRSVSIVDRRVFLGVFIPLLLANTLSILQSETRLQMNWRAWLILVADLALIAGAVWASRGFQVYGLKADDVERILGEALVKQGFAVDIHSGEARDLWGRVREARFLTAHTDQQKQSFSITPRFNEVLLRGDQRHDERYLRQALPVIKGQQVPYDFKAHTVGVLYIILALVFAVLAWIFFFEPRLILTE